METRARRLVRGLTAGIGLVALFVSAAVAAVPAVPRNAAEVRPAREAERVVAEQAARPALRVVRQPSWNPVARVVGRVLVGDRVAIVGPDRGDLFGYAACEIDDIDADGVADVAIAAPLAGMRTELCGRVYLHSGADGRLLAEVASGSDDPTRRFGTGLSRMSGRAGRLLVRWETRNDLPGAARRAGVEVVSVGMGVSVGEEPSWLTARGIDWSLAPVAADGARDGMTPGLASDVNADRCVDGRDLQCVLARFGYDAARAVEGPQAARRAWVCEDINADDRVDALDLAALLGEFGRGAEGPGVAAAGDCGPPSGDAPPGSTFGDCFGVCPGANCPIGGGGGGDGGTGSGGGGCPGDVDCDGIGDRRDCDQSGNSASACECQDADGDGCKNQNDCDSSCYTGPAPRCLCDVVLRPDPATHSPESTIVYLLPGDEEIVHIFGTRPACADITVVASGPIRILDKDKMVMSIDVPSVLTTVSIVGLGPGTGSLQVVDDSGTCGSVEVRVGGRAVVEYDRAPTYQIQTGNGRLRSSKGAAYDSGLPGDDVGSAGPWEFGGGPREAISDDVHAVANSIAPLKSTYRVTLFDADGQRKRGRPVRLCFKNGKVQCPSSSAPWLSDTQVTNEDGYVDFELLANADRIAQLNAGQVPTFEDRTGDSEPVLALIGRSAMEPITEDTIDLLGAASTFENHVCTGVSLKYDRMLTVFDPEAAVLTGIVSPLALANHTQYLVAYHWLVSPQWADQSGLIGRTLALIADFESGAFELVQVEPDPLRPWQFKPLAGQFRAVIAAEFQARGIPLEPWIPHDNEPAPPGTAESWLAGEFTFGTVTADLVLAAVPLGDGAELWRQYYYRPTYLGEEPDYYVVSVSAIGFAADFGYILFPPGALGFAVGNLAIGVVKVAFKHAPRLAGRSLLAMGSTLSESIEMLIAYLSRTRRAPGVSDEVHAANLVAQVVNEGRILERGTARVGAEFMGDTVKLLLDRASRDFSHEAFEGAGYLIARGHRVTAEALFSVFDEAIVERTLVLVRHLELDSGHFTAESIRGIAVAVQRVGLDSPLVEEFLRGTAVSGANAARKALALSNLSHLQDVAGLDEMVAYLRHNRNNASGINGVIYEGTVARRVIAGEVDQAGVLARVSHDGIPGYNVVDTTTSTRAIQIKHKSTSTHMVPSDIRNGSLNTDAYLDALKEQARLLGLQPTLITNLPLNADLQSMLNARGIAWIQVAD